MGATAVLLIFIAIFAGSLRNDIAIQPTEEETALNGSGDAEQLEKAESKGKSDGIFSRRPPPPSEIGPQGDRPLNSFDNPQQDGGFASLPDPNETYAPSPFVDPNSGFAGASKDPGPAAKADLTLPNAPQEVNEPAPIQSAPGI